jgi:hypothetical protein
VVVPDQQLAHSNARDQLASAGVNGSTTT